MVAWFAVPENSLQLSIWIASVGIVIWTLEYLKQFRAFHGDGLFSWGLLKYQHPFAIADTTIARGLNLLFRYPNVLFLLVLRLLAALLLVLFVSYPWARLLGIFGIYLTNILIFNIWSPYKRGSDGLTEVQFGALMLLQLGGESHHVVRAGLWFIAFQVCVSYCANGIVKIGKPAWTQGTAVFGIANHHVSGTPSAARFVLPTKSHERRHLECHGDGVPVSTGFGCGLAMVLDISGVGNPVSWYQHICDRIEFVLLVLCGHVPGSDLPVAVCAGVDPVTANHGEPWGRPCPCHLAQYSRFGIPDSEIANTLQGGTYTHLESGICHLEWIFSQPLISRRECRGGPRAAGRGRARRTCVRPRGWGRR